MKALLLANIGGSPEGFYHIGDEAMFYATYCWYKEYTPQIKLTTIVDYPNHENLDIIEKIGMSWPGVKVNPVKYYAKICLKVFLKQLMHRSYLSDGELRIYETLKSQDIIHFCGGGNINSLFRTWLYYALTIIVISKFLGKKVIMTSQTIGPLWGVDRLLTPLILNFVSVIGLRENTNKKNVLVKNGIFFPKVIGMVDAAYGLPAQSTYHLPLKSSSVRIGLSLHAWQKYETEIVKISLSIIKDIYKVQDIEIVLIPHVLAKDPGKWDPGFMDKLIQQLPEKIRIISPTYRQVFKSATRPSLFIKYLSANVDLLITSRYHGLIFALSENVPCVTFLMDSYYQRKNLKALEMFYNNESINYIVNLDSPNASVDAVRKSKKIITHLQSEKDKLKVINEKIITTKASTLLGKIMSLILPKNVYLET